MSGLNSREGALFFASGIDTRGLAQDATKAQGLIKGITNTAVKEGQQMDKIFRQLSVAMAGYFTLSSSKQFINDIVRVRGEFQQLQVAFETMLGSKMLADQMMADIIEISIKSPFTMMEVAQNTKQLMAMGIEADKVKDTIKALGDVAAGVSVPLQRIAINYGQVAALGRLQEREIRDFAMAGIPLVEELGKILNKETEEIKAMVSAGKIGFGEVEQAFVNMSSEGGRFANLMEKQMTTVTGKISNLRDAFDRMLNTIGQANEGAIYGSIEALASLVENYDQVIDVLKVVIATYGTYKAATIVNSILLQVEAVGSLTAAFKNLIVVQKAYNAVSRANPVGLAFSAIAGIVGAIHLWNKRSKETVSIQTEINTTISKEVTSLNALFKVLKNSETGTKKRADAIKLVNSRYKDYLGNMIDEKTKLEDIEKAQKKVTNALIANISVKSAKAKLEAEMTDLSESFDKEFSGFVDVFAKEYGADRLTDFIGALYEGVDKRIKAEGGKVNRGVLEFSSIAKDIYDEYIADISKKTGYLEYSFSDFQDAFLDFAETKVDNNNVVDTLNAIIDAYSELIKLPDEDNGESGLETFTSVNSLEKFQKEIIHARKQVEFNLQQARIDAMKDGLQKTLKQNELNFQQELFQLEQQKDEMLETIQRNELEKFKALGGEKKDFKPTTTELPESDKQYFDELTEMYKEAYKKANEDAYAQEEEKNNELIRQFETYQQARIRIAKQYAEKIKQLEETGAPEINIDVAKKAMEKEIAELDDKFQGTSGAMARYFADASRKSQSEIRAMVASGRRLLKALDGDFNEGNEWGLTEEQFNVIKESPEKIKALEEAINSLEESASESVLAFKKVENGIKRIGNSKGSLLEFNKGLVETLDGVNAITTGLSFMAEAAENIGNALDISSLSGSAEELKKVVEVIDKAGQGAAIGGQIGGGWGALIGGIIGLGSGLAKALDNSEKKQQIAVDKANALLDVLELQNIELERQLRLMSQLSGEERTEAENQTLSTIQDQIDELNRLADETKVIFQKGDAKWEFDASSVEDLEYFLTHLDEFSNDWTSSRIGVKTFQEWLEKGFDIKNLDVLQEYINKYYELLEQRDRLFEEFTQTSEDSITDSIIEGFRNGKTAVEDFASTFEDLMKEALLESFKKQFVLQAVSDFYAAFGEAVAPEDGQGLTADEIKALKDMWDNSTSQLREQFEAFDEMTKEIFGTSIFGEDGSDDSGLAGAIKRELTEETGSMLAGLFNVMSIDVRTLLTSYQTNAANQASMMMQTITILNEIEENTNRTADNTDRLEKIENILSDIRDGSTSTTGKR